MSVLGGFDKITQQALTAAYVAYCVIIQRRCVCCDLVVVATCEQLVIRLTYLRTVITA